MAHISHPDLKPDQNNVLKKENICPIEPPKSNKMCFVENRQKMIKFQRHNETQYRSSKFKCLSVSYAEYILNKSSDQFYWFETSR